MAYEAPSVTRIASIADLTRGNTPDLGGDGLSGRGNATTPPPVTS